MATIVKKINTKSFEAIIAGKKKSEIRLNDFDIKEGDILILEEWDSESPRKPTGRSITKKVIYVNRIDIKDYFWAEKEIIEKGLQVISLE